MFRRLGLVLGAGAVLAVVGCSGRPGVALLSDAAALDGWLRIEARVAEQTRVLEGALRYDRASADLSFVRGEAGAEVALERRGADARPRKSVGGVEVEVQLEDLGDLALLMSVLQGRPEDRAEIRALDDGYAIVGQGQELRVWFRAGATAGG